MGHWPSLQTSNWDTWKVWHWRKQLQRSRYRLGADQSIEQTKTTNTGEHKKQKKTRHWSYYITSWTEKYIKDTTSVYLHCSIILMANNSKSPSPRHQAMN